MSGRTAVIKRRTRAATRFLVAAIVSCLLSLDPRVALAQSDTVQGRTKDLRADSVRRDSVRNLLGPELRRLASIRLDIPEYDDDQGLPNGSGEFGPRVNIIASPMLDGFTDEWQIEEQGDLGALVAVLLVDPPSGGGTSLPPTYTKLSLVVGINCLWLSYKSTDPPATRWKGHIAPATASGECDRKVTTSELTVVRKPHSSHPNHEDYPPVGRFTETKSGQPLLGTSCIKAWCDFGPSTTADPPRDVGGSGGGREDHVKGWHDEQRLAEKNSSNVLTQGPRARITPVPNVNKHKQTYFDGHWRKVAKIEILDPLPASSKYSKAGLRMGLNTLELKRTFHAPPAPDVWTAQVTPAGGSPHTLSYVVADPHYDGALPGTARWRWMPDDEGVWVPCGQQCCRAKF